jgi:hypothetical protein
MKTLTILTAIVAAMTVATAHAKPTAPQTHQPGAPLVQGKYCWVYTSSHGYGYWDECDGGYLYPRGISLQGYPDQMVIGAENGEAGGSAGGGGGGGGSQ